MQKYFKSFKKAFSIFKPKEGDERKLREKLRDKYRLILKNSDTFEEVGAFDLSPLNVYAFFSSFFVGTALFIFLLLVYTPLKRYIPGYGNFDRDEEISILTEKVKNLEYEIKATRTYSDNIRSILTGNVEHLSREAVEKNTETLQDSAIRNDRVGRVPEDEALRTQVARQKRGANKVATRNAANVDLPIEQIFFVAPVSGEVMAGFDVAKSHFALDIAAPKNTAVKSCADGVVISAGYTVETGHSIAVQHPDNLVSFYKHNSVLLKKTGDRVQAGEALAIIGNTGELTTGPHLHFELWYRGRPINPSDYINFN